MLNMTAIIVHMNHRPIQLDLHPADWLIEGKFLPCYPVYSTWIYVRPKPLTPTPTSQILQSNRGSSRIQAHYCLFIGHRNDQTFLTFDLQTYLSIVIYKTAYGKVHKRRLHPDGAQTNSRGNKFSKSNSPKMDQRFKAGNSGSWHTVPLLFPVL